MRKPNNKPKKNRNTKDSQDAGTKDSTSDGGSKRSTGRIVYCVEIEKLFKRDGRCLTRSRMAMNVFIGLNALIVTAVLIYSIYEITQWGKIRDELSRKTAGCKPNWFRKQCAICTEQSKEVNLGMSRWAVCVDEMQETNLSCMWNGSNVQDYALCKDENVSNKIYDCLINSVLLYDGPYRSPSRQ